MKILITGICGFVGSALARALLQTRSGVELIGLDNFIRPGSESNRAELKQLGVKLYHGDIRAASDLEAIPPVDAVIDAAANPSVLAGIDGVTSSRQLVEHNLLGTINLLEYCKRHGAAFILLSTSRVYALKPLASLPVEVTDGAYRPEIGQGQFPAGVTERGVSEIFSTIAPVSLYGATKLASESLALDYGESFGFRVFINRCGVLAGAGQFGRADQGIFAYWINSHLNRRSLAYIGFDGMGHQVRDCLHPCDLVPLLLKQLDHPSHRPVDERIINCSGGAASAMSLRQLTAWCDEQFGPHPIGVRPEARPFDIPWMVLDSTKAKNIWGWSVSTPTASILDEISNHARQNPDWLSLSAPL
jgi:CDP-paratose 2-epimerase